MQSAISPELAQTQNFNISLGSSTSNKSKNSKKSHHDLNSSNLSPAVQALDNVLSYLDRSPEKICLAEAQGLGFLMNPRLREILAVHDHLKNSQIEHHKEKSINEVSPDVDEVLYELQQQNISWSDLQTCNIVMFYCLII